ncbi:signal peptidase I [Helicobacter cynogastricus]|uniref:signal peptidase I n=1 Tax=Helicobacter cynogastricus TaxID=329937 RepID=UPI000CF0FDB4|nr:signal peptidase I [Helicobacter cynogastricus]
MLKKINRFISSWTGSLILVLLAIFFIAQAFIIPSRSMVGTLYEGDMLFVKKFSYGIPIPRLPWLDIPLLPDFKGNGHLIEGKRPQRGEVVVFIPPTNKGYYVKRLFAVGGDEVIFNQEGFYLHPKESDGDSQYIRKHFPHHQIKQFLGKDFVFAPYASAHKGIFYAQNNRTFEVMQALATHQVEIKGVSVSMPLIELEGETLFYTKIEPDHFFMIGDNRDDSSDSRFWGSVPYSHIVGTPWFVYFSLNLTNSEGTNDPKDIFKVRWKRMFKSLSGLEAIAGESK